MKLKGDKSMIKHISYIADDGTTFEDENECYKYERGLMLKKCERNIHMWDYNFQPISITGSQVLDKVFYLTCDTADAVKIISKWFEDMHCSSPFDGYTDYSYAAGRHYYYQDNKWYEADKLIDKARKMMKIFGV